MKLLPCTLLLLIYFAFSFSVSGIDIFFKTGFTLSVFSICSLNESPDFGTSRKSNTVQKQPESLQGGFYCFFPCYQKLMGKAMHFPCGKVYHRMGIWWKKSTHTLGKVCNSISQAISIRWVSLHFPMLWEIDGETNAFPIWWSIPQDGNLMVKRTHTMETVWEPISHAFPSRWVLLPFLML